MFHIDLPTELTLLVLSYLPLSSLGSVLRLNHAWNDFIDVNRHTVFHNAAFVEGFIGRRTMGLAELVGIYSNRVTVDAGWKEFCKSRKMIERSWCGHAASTVLPSPRQPEQAIKTHNTRVHRFKVDEKAGILMATSQLGGLVVRDLETDDVKWELPMWYVRAYAHLEYGHGYMIFDREDGNKEVWRRTVAHDVTTPVAPASAPDEPQQHVMRYISRLSASPPENQYAFEPHAVLHMPEPTRAFRFVYPDLLVASRERAYLWDVRAGEVSQVVDSIQVIHDEEDEDDEGNQDASISDEEDMTTPAPAQPLSLPQAPIPLSQLAGPIQYIDLSARHLFFARRHVVCVFSRETGSCVLQLPSLHTARAVWEVSSDLDAEGAGAVDTYTQAKEQRRELVRVPVRTTTSTLDHAVVDQFIAVHVSNDGKHIVALLSGSRLIIIPHFEDLLAYDHTHSSPSFPPPTASTSTSTTASACTPGHHKRRKNWQAERRAREETLRTHMLEVQLGPPAASSAVYLAYESDIHAPGCVGVGVGAGVQGDGSIGIGRIGVVTTNAVYIVTPRVPPPSPLAPTSTSTSTPARDITVSRIPYFSNPAWLSAVSCLMLSDTGLYLNWNFTWPIVAVSIGGIVVDDGDLSGVVDRAYQEMEERAMQQRWEQEFQHDLEVYESDVGRRYLASHDGDLFVVPMHRELAESEVSTVYRVDFCT